MDLRKKFGLLAFIYALSMLANLVTSCWCILIYFQSAFVEFQTGSARQDEVDQIRRQVQRQIDEWDRQKDAGSLSYDSTPVLTQITEAIDRVVHQPNRDAEAQAVWEGILHSSETCQRIAERRRAAVQAATPGTAPAEGVETLLTEEREALAELHLLLSNVISGFEQQRLIQTAAAGQTQQRVVEILIVNTAVGATLCVMGLLLVRRWVLQPVADLRVATREISSGNFAHRIHARANDELGQLAGEVNQMSETIVSMQIKLVEQERLAAAGEMVTRLAHNIRNPLAGIRGLAEATVQRPGVDPETIECQTRIINTIDRFEKWLRDLQQSVSPLNLKLQQIAIEDLTANVMTALQPMFDRRQVEVLVHIAPEVGQVEVDPLHFEQALVSLITNAVQASRAGQSVRVSVDPVPDSPTQWQISVEDEGVGIPEEIREKIFLPYFTTKPDGNGVGLAMVSKVVKIHGGRLSVESEVGRGSRFTAVLPGRVQGV